MLTGSEVKSLREGRASLVDGFAQVRDRELYLHGVHIPEYTQATWTNHEPRRVRKLLLHRGEIDKLIAQQTSVTDPAERRRIFADVQRVFGEQVPALYFAAPRLYMGVSARTVNLAPSVLRPQLLWSVDTIAVTP